MDKILLTLIEAAYLTNLAPGKLLALARARQMPHVRQGKQILFPRRELEAWVSQQAKRSTDAVADDSADDQLETTGSHSPPVEHIRWDRKAPRLTFGRGDSSAAR